MISSKLPIISSMKRLFIVRHAKSSWDYPHLTDFERPLNKRGIRDLPDMADRFKQLHLDVDCLISSPANRALATAQGFASAIGIPYPQIKLEERFFHASHHTIKEVLSKLDNKLKSVTVFGHNPGLTYLINDLSDFYLDNLPTCAICGIDFEFNTWSDILYNKGKQFYYDFPKSRIF